MNTNAEKADGKREVYHFGGLPNEAKKELLKYYEFLLYKYREEKSGIFMNDIAQRIEKLSWEMGGKLYKSRDELYER